MPAVASGDWQKDCALAEFMNKTSRYDLISLSVIALVSIFSLCRFNYLPQFIDGYYHLSVANAFLKSGGWVGWSWWDFAPLGRPHLYPPLYHFILAGLIKSGISGINAVRLTEVSIVPLFFINVWYVFRRLTGVKFAFFTTFILSGFFPFYSSVSANVPASLALIFGVFTWFFTARRQTRRAVLMLTLCFYTHAAIPWLFFISLVFAAVFDQDYRKIILKIIILSLIFYSPLLDHQIKYLSYLNIKVWAEASYTYVNIFVMLFGLFSLFKNLRNNTLAYRFFLGYVLAGAVIFAKYPYRFFSAQGFIGPALISAWLLEQAVKPLKGLGLHLFVVAVSVYLFLFSSILSINRGDPKVELMASTCYKFINGSMLDVGQYQSSFYPGYYNDVIAVIKKNTSPDDIISSNVMVISQIFSSLCNRPCANSMLMETRPKNISHGYENSKIIVWLKDVAGSKGDFKHTGWEKILENDILYVFLNHNCRVKAVILPAKIRFIRV